MKTSKLRHTNLQRLDYLVLNDLADEVIGLRALVQEARGVMANEGEDVWCKRADVYLAEHDE